eukprot:gene10876-biopygen462
MTLHPTHGQLRLGQAGGGSNTTDRSISNIWLYLVITVAVVAGVIVECVLWRRRKKPVVVLS